MAVAQITVEDTMAGVTITGAIGSTPVFFPTSTSLQTALAQQILGAAFSTSTTELVTGAGGAITGPLVLDLSASGTVLLGAASITGAQIALGGQDGTYITRGSAFSAVVAADGSNSSVVNDTATSGLTAATGIGGNVLLGLAGVNQFISGIGGQDVVILNGAANNLQSNGTDAVLVGGPTTISAATSGLENIVLTGGTTLAFTNGTKAGSVDSITGAANGSVIVAGTGATSITAGIGPESFFLDTSSGNVTLTGSLQAGSTLEFIKNLDKASANITVNTVQTGQVVDIHGYTGFNVASLSGNAGGSLLQLSDGSQVTFNNVSVAALQQSVKSI